MLIYAKGEEAEKQGLSVRKKTLLKGVGNQDWRPQGSELKDENNICKSNWPLKIRLGLVARVRRQTGGGAGQRLKESSSSYTSTVCIL